MMIIPREGDIVRLYTQLSNEEAREVLNVNGRVDMTKWGPEKLLDVSMDILRSVSELKLSCRFVNLS